MDILLMFLGIPFRLMIAVVLTIIIILLGLIHPIGVGATLKKIWTTFVLGEWTMNNEIHS